MNLFSVRCGGYAIRFKKQHIKPEKDETQVIIKMSFWKKRKAIKQR